MPAKYMTKQELTKQSELQTECPYTYNMESLNTKNESIKRLNESGAFKIKHQKNEGEDDDEESVQYFYDAQHIKKMNELEENRVRDKRRRNEEREAKKNEPCWFCLGGTKVQRHYIVSVGDKCYLAYAKGALNKDHLLIIPIDHCQSSLHADDTLLEDINKYKNALANYYKDKNQCVLFYERNFRTKHMQIQCFAVKMDKIYLLKDSFLSVAKEHQIQLNEIPKNTNLKQVLEKHHSFFYLELPNEENDKSDSTFITNCDRYLSPIRTQQFPINFGR
jgi:hypothetical protein